MNMANKKILGRTMLRRLKRQYPTTGPFVAWKTPLELVIGTVLSAQCTDQRVNIVTKTLFKKYKTARDYAKANLKILEREIYTTGFYKSKARYLKGIGTLLEKEFGGRVPNRREDLLKLPGVSYKSANLIMAKAFGTPTGVAVDTHVMRVTPRLALTNHRDPKKIAADLEALFPASDWLNVNEYLITHGRAICKPQPRCGDCVLNDICPYGIRALKRRRAD